LTDIARFLNPDLNGCSIIYHSIFGDKTVKSFCKTLVLGLLIGVITMLPIGKAYCQSPPEPAIVVSIAKFKEQMDDVNYLLTASGFAQMKFMAGAMIKGYTKGLDDGKDAGVLIYFNEESQTPDFLGFVPVTNMEEMLDVIAQMAEVDEGDEFTTIVTDDGTELIVKSQDGYAFFSNKKEMFDNLSAKPADLLGDLPSKYNLSAKVFAQRIPEKLRNQVMDLIKESSSSTLDNLDDDLQAEMQRKNLEMQIQQMELMFKEADTFTMGMTADKDAKSLVMDLEFAGLPDSELAKMLVGSAPNQPSRFTGFLMDGATFTHNQCVRIQKDEAERYSKALDELKTTALKEMNQEGDLSEQDIEIVDRAFSNVVDVIKETLAEGILDSGAVVMLKDGKVNFAMGGQISNPKKIESTVKELVAMAKEKMAGELTVHLNSGSHKNVTFHEVVIPIPDSEEEMREALGDQITVVVGIGTKEVYLAGGSDPVETLKGAIDGTHMAKDLMQFNFYVTPMLEFAAGLQGDPSVEKMAAALKESGNDRISMTSNLIENGVKMRFEMQDGILGLIKVGFDAFSQGGGGGGFPGGNDDF
jgi:hypothetical protein